MQHKMHVAQRRLIIWHGLLLVFVTCFGIRLNRGDQRTDFTHIKGGFLAERCTSDALRLGFCGLHAGNEALKTCVCALHTAGTTNKARIMVQGQHQSIHFKNQLLRIGIRFQMMLIDRLLGGSVQGALPAIDHVDQMIANRTWPVVVLNSTADVNTT